MELYANQDCMRSKCKKKRGDKGIRKFITCKNCFVGVYCSRKCAKYDWNKGYHKMYCQILGHIARK